MHDMVQFKKIPHKLIGQDAATELLKLERQIIGSPFHEQNLATNPRYNHLCRNKKRIIIKEDVLYRFPNNDFNESSHIQVLIPIQLKDPLLDSRHGQASKQPRICKIMQEVR